MRWASPIAMRNSAIITPTLTIEWTKVCHFWRTRSRAERHSWAASSVRVRYGAMPFLPDVEPDRAAARRIVVSDQDFVSLRDRCRRHDRDKRFLDVLVILGVRSVGMVIQ